MIMVKKITSESIKQDEQDYITEEVDYSGHILSK